MVRPAEIANAVFDALEGFGVDPGAITRDATFADLGVDSLDLAELIQLLDDRFGVSFADADMKRLTTVGDLLSYASGEAEAA